eukprot:jgi/Ulvmu1/5379/UM022_0174.1
MRSVDPRLIDPIMHSMYDVFPCIQQRDDIVSHLWPVIAIALQHNLNVDGGTARHRTAMLGLVDYSSSGDNSDVSLDPRPPAPEAVEHDSAGPLVEGGTAASSAANTSAVDQISGTEDSQPCVARQFDHAPGQWALTVLLTVKPMPAPDILDTFRAQASALVNATAYFCVASACDDAGQAQQENCRRSGKDCYHVSLSRTQPGSFSQRRTLLHGLQQAAAGWHAQQMRLSSLQVFSNDNSSRAFLAVTPDRGAPAIRHLIKRVDRIMLRHRLQPFYDNPQPHVSLLWWSGDMRESIQNHLPRLQGLWSSLVGAWQCQASDIVLQFGHERHFIS